MNQKIIIGAITDFIITGGAVLLGASAVGGAASIPTLAVLISAVVTGAIGAAKHVRGMLMDPKA